MSFRILLRTASLLCSAALSVTSAKGQLSQSLPIDFYGDVPSRSLRGLAVRADGALVSGPVLTELQGTAGAELYWTIEAAGDGKWLIGTDGQILEASVDASRGTVSTRPLARVEEAQVFAVKRLRDGSVLAGTSPHGALVLTKQGRVTTRVPLPVDSIFDLLLLDDRTALAATGNPGRIYKIDLPLFASAGVIKDSAPNEQQLAGMGISRLTEIRDRNVRRLARLGDRVIAGSAPRGNIYSIPVQGGAPTLLQENRGAEITALLPNPDGGFYATLVFGNAGGERPSSPAPLRPDSESIPAPAAPEKFSGRSTVVFFPPDQFPETLFSRTGVAFYSLSRVGDTLLIGGGEQGELLGFDLPARQSMTLPGSLSSQLNQITAVPNEPGRFVVLRNNAPGLALLDFNAAGPRQAETRRLDLGIPSRIGAFRVEIAHGLDPSQASVQLRTSASADDVEAWSSWLPMTRHQDGWIASNARGRYVRLRFELPATSTPELDRASLYFLPQNRRPQLAEFRLLPPNLAVLRAPDPAPSATMTVAQLTGTERERDDARRSRLLSSNVVPAPGSQVALWNVTDPDGDDVACTFSVRREGTNTWTDLAVGSKAGLVTFDLGTLEEGIHRTRLVAQEQPPRPAGDQLTATFQTADLIVDRTPPSITAASAGREERWVVVTVTAHDQLDLLQGMRMTFNNGYEMDVAAPDDGILDSGSESFTARIPMDLIAGATAVEIRIADRTGNSSAKRLEIK